jgi:hypothetical protein
LLHRNVKSQKKKKGGGDISSGNVAETVRIAAIVQKGMSTGRSSYVEMRALGRLTGRNVKSQVLAIKSLLNDMHYKPLLNLVSEIPFAMADGYVSTLTPNGIVRKEKLDQLISIDSDIVTCLGMVESNLKSSRADGRQARLESTAETLTELLGERKRLVDSLRASSES